MANPIALRGQRKLIDKISDEMRQIANKLDRDAGFTGEAGVEVEGDFQFNKVFAIDGGLVVKPALPADIPADVEVDLTHGIDADSLGNGKVRVYFRISVQRDAQVE